MSLVFAFDSAGVDAAPVVLTQGTAGLDYADAGTGTCTTNGTSHAYSAGDTCPVNLTYTPAFAGTRLGNLQFAGVSISLSGVGMGYQLVFPTTSNNLLRYEQFGFLPGLLCPGGIRVVQVDYGLNHLPNNAGNSENMLRVSAGLVFRLR
jgi:hypothetical protein